MAGMKKKHEKERVLRKEIQEKSKQTREELQGQLLRGVREEQLDAKPGDALSPKHRLSRLSALGAERPDPNDMRVIKAKDYVSQLPERWQRLLGAEFSVDQWKLMGADTDDLVNLSPVEPRTLAFADESLIRSVFYQRCYEDDETMKLIKEAYMMGAQAANTAMTSTGPMSSVTKVKELVETQRRVIEFLLEDFSEQINPVLHLTPRELVERITLYFIECDLLKRFYTVPGLAFHIGFASREEFLAYVNETEPTIHTHIIKRAMMHIESERVTDMLYGGGLMAGHKLDLATNFNYNDAGKKGGESPQSQTNITVNNNTLNMDSAPPKFTTIEEWQKSYMINMAAAKVGKLLDEKQSEREAQTQSPVIDVAPQEQNG